jgi:hypothetical protein
MQSRWIAATVAVVCAGAAALAQKAPAPANPFASVTKLHCTFTAFAAAQWASDGPKVVSNTQDFTFDIDSFDWKKNRARVVGSSGSTLVTLLASQTGLNAIEQTPIGNVNLTTVFTTGATPPKYLAAHSRHLGDTKDPPRVSQTYGTCDSVQ